jgi:hypothetical protein
MFLSNKKNNKTPETKKASLQNPKILEVNLVKGESKPVVDWSKNAVFAVLVFLIAAIFVGEAYYALSWWEKQEEILNENVQAEVDKLNQDIVRLKKSNADALAYQSRAASFSKLIDSHVYWNNFFSWIERNTLSSVRYSSFNGDLNGSYSLQAKADSYADVSWQTKAFLNSSSTKDVKIREVRTGSGKDGEKLEDAKGVSFSIQLQVDPNIFKN